MEEQVVAIFAGVNGYLDELPLESITDFEEKFLNEVRGQHGEVLDAIRSEREISDATEEKLKSILDDFTRKYA